MLCLPLGFRTRTRCAAPAASCSRWFSERTVSIAEIDRRRRRWRERPSRDRRACSSCRSDPARAPTSRRPAAPGRTAIARYSEAIATQSSFSRHHRRLAGDRVAQHREPVGRPDRERVEAVEIRQAALERLLQRGAARASATSGIRPRPRCRCRSGSGSRRAAACAAGGCGSRASRCGPGTGRARCENGCECCVVTRLSVAIRVCPSACVPAISPSAKRSMNDDGGPASLKISIVVPALITRSSGWCSASHAWTSASSAPIDEHRVRRAHARRRRLPERRRKLAADLAPVELGIGRVERDLGRPRPAPDRGRTQRRRCQGPRNESCSSILERYSPSSALKRRPTSDTDRLFHTRR